MVATLLSTVGMSLNKNEWMTGSTMLSRYGVIGR